MEKAAILNELTSLIQEGNTVIIPTSHESGYPYPIQFVQKDLYDGWRNRIIVFLGLFLDDTSEFLKTVYKSENNSLSHAISCIKILESVQEFVEKDYIGFQQKPSQDSYEDLRLLFQRFHRVARQLQSRHDGRSTITINDEYDVQDLLHALLQLHFNDIRAEEWTPSYAGKSARVDFLLKQERIVIEVKKTRKGLGDKEIGDQLIIDVDRYKAHPDCERLICFVYDPEGRIGNPVGIMNDLNQRHDGFATVIIEPNN